VAKSAWTIESKSTQGSWPVVRLKLNDFGLYDMHGNVFEWCHDYYGEDYYKQSQHRIQRGQSPALIVFCGVGRGAPRFTLVPLTAKVSPLITVTTIAVFGWFVSWTSSVVILDLCNAVSLDSEIATHIYAPAFVISPYAEVFFL
jgi:hypothetical protein